MTTLDSLLEAVENYRGREEETKSENNDVDFYNVLAFDHTGGFKIQGQR